MDKKEQLSRIIHDIDSRCSSIKSAAKLYRDCTPEEQREMLALMKEAAENLLKSVEALSNS